MQRRQARHDATPRIRSTLHPTLSTPRPQPRDTIVYFPHPNPCLSHSRLYPTCNLSLHPSTPLSRPLPPFSRSPVSLPVDQLSKLAPSPHVLSLLASFAHPIPSQPIHPHPHSCHSPSTSSPLPPVNSPIPGSMHVARSLLPAYLPPQHHSAPASERQQRNKRG